MWLGSPLRTIGSISQVKFTESRSTIRPRRSPTAKILLEEQFRAKKKRDRRWELGIERCELTRAL